MAPRNYIAYCDCTDSVTLATQGDVIPDQCLKGEASTEKIGAYQSLASIIDENTLRQIEVIQMHERIVGKQLMHNVRLRDVGQIGIPPCRFTFEGDTEIRMGIIDWLKKAKARVAKMISGLQEGGNE